MEMCFEELQNYRYPALIQTFSALITIAGTAFIGVLYALLTEKTPDPEV